MKGNIFLLDLKDLSGAEIIIRDNKNLTLDSYKIYLEQGK